MNIEEFVSKNIWQECNVEIDGETISFVIFDWNEVKTREEDGQSNIYEYFIGWETEAYEKVSSGDWIPFGAGNMYAGALKYDGGFQEFGNAGMLFADLSQSKDIPGIIFVGENGESDSVKIAGTLSSLEIIAG
jgi:hypothetical protein